MQLHEMVQRVPCGSLRLVFAGMLCIGLAGMATAQSDGTLPDRAVLQQMIEAWSATLVSGDMKALAIYYAVPQAVTPWKERIESAKVTQATLLAIHDVLPPEGVESGGLPLVCKVRFTMEYWLENLDRPLNETRVWTLTNKEGFLQVAFDVREKEPALPPRNVERSQFPTLGDTPSQPVIVGEGAPLPAVPPASTDGSKKVTPVATPSLNEGPIDKQELINQLWNQLLVKFKKAYENRSEKYFKSLFVKEPEIALEKFRNDLEGRNWIQVTRLEIDEDSVRGNNLNAQFRFRYALWGTGMKRDQIVEVECAAIRGGPGWRFSKFGPEVLAQPQRAPGYYMPDSMVQPYITPPRQGWSLFGK